MPRREESIRDIVEEFVPISGLVNHIIKYLGISVIGYEYFGIFCHRDFTYKGWVNIPRYHLNKLKYDHPRPDYIDDEYVYVYHYKMDNHGNLWAITSQSYVHQYAIVTSIYGRKIRFPSDLVGINEEYLIYDNHPLYLRHKLVGGVITYTLIKDTIRSLEFVSSGYLDLYVSDNKIYAISNSDKILFRYDSDKNEMEQIPYEPYYPSLNQACLHAAKHPYRSIKGTKCDYRLSFNRKNITNEITLTMRENNKPVMAVTLTFQVGNIFNTHTLIYDDYIIHIDLNKSYYISVHIPYIIDELLGQWNKTMKLI